MSFISAQSRHFPQTSGISKAFFLKELPLIGYFHKPLNVQQLLKYSDQSVCHHKPCHTLTKWQVRVYNVYTGINQQVSLYLFLRFIQKGCFSLLWTFKNKKELTLSNFQSRQMHYPSKCTKAEYFMWISISNLLEITSENL